VMNRDKYTDKPQEKQFDIRAIHDIFIQFSHSQVPTRPS
jgi:hypothetical protein